MAHFLQHLMRRPLARRVRTRRLFVPALALALGCTGGCSQSAALRPAGPTAPTVAGRAPPDFSDAAAARAAFTRVDDDTVVTATLEDVAWLRFEGTPEEVEKAHPAYFLDGATTFDVLLRTETFVQPTSETWVLEDGAGRRVVTRPTRYQGTMGREDRRFVARFTLVFDHGITQDTRFLRLIRPADGTTLEWTLE